MQYHVNRDGTEIGLFSLDELRAALQRGEVQPSDLVWREGMENWTTISALADLQLSAPSEPVAPTDPDPQFGPADQETTDRDEATAEGAYSGPPWENLATGHVGQRAWATIMAAVLAPTNFFRNMRTEGGLGQPLLFYVGVAWIALIINSILELPFQYMMAGNGEETAAWAMSPLILAIFAPLFVVIGAFISAGMTHLCLMLLGGATRPFEATFRVNCYAYGSLSVLQIIPLIGGFISGIWGIVLEIIGVAEAHEISRGKAALAVLLPTLLCCGIIVMLVGAGVGAAFLSR